MNLFIFNFFAGTPLSGWGERHFYLSRELVKQGHQVTIFSSANNHMFNRRLEVKGKWKIEETEGVRFVWLKVMEYNPKSAMRFISMIKFAWDLYRMKMDRFGKPDAIYVSSMPIFSILPGIRKSRKYNVPLLFEIRDVWPLTPIMLGNVSRRNPMIQLIGFLEKLGYQKANRVISVLPNTKEHVINRGGSAQKWTHLPNGISEDLSVYSSSAPECVVSQIPKDKFIVMYTGTIGLANALEYVVHAAGELISIPEIHFVLVGDGYKKEELREVQRSRGMTNITWLPKVKKDEVHDLLRRADMCLISWHDRPLYDLGVSANKYFDYMLAGKPILSAGNIPGDPVSLAECGLIVRAESPSSIADGIKSLYQMSTSARQQLGNNGKKYVLRNHTYSRLANQLLGIIMESI